MARLPGELARLPGELNWTQEHLNIFGKTVARRRLTAVCGRSMDPASRYRRPNPTVASTSLGATRTFQLRPRASGPRITIPLGHGDLLVMGGHTQDEYLHSIAKVTRPTGPRISLTYRHYATTQARP